jgi:hypothetical protein
MPRAGASAAVWSVRVSVRPKALPAAFRSISFAQQK